eukprot:9634459-Karenia_brevis.AAC.1
MATMFLEKHNAVTKLMRHASLWTKRCRLCESCYKLVMHQVWNIDIFPLRKRRSLMQLAARRYKG